MSACDAVDGSSTGIAMCHIALVIRERQNVAYWHKAEVRRAAPEGLVTSGLPTLGTECLVSGGKPTVF